MVNKLYRFTNHILIQTIHSLKYYTKIHTIYTNTRDIESERRNLIKESSKVSFLTIV